MGNGGGGVTDLITGGQSDKFYTTGRQSANGPKLRWVYCNYPYLKIISFFGKSYYSYENLITHSSAISLKERYMIG